ncbi:hypothetical protein IBX73_01190 [candidate division WOR-3 bacterium]|nr:hypothetical protein [candidate division WOR-3 bacterium]
MRIFLTTLFLLGALVTLAIAGGDEYDGLMPAVEVTAARHQSEAPAYVGSMDGVEVTAPRYEFEDEAWSGLMPEVEVTAKRPGSGPLARTVNRETNPKRSSNTFSIMIH